MKLQARVILLPNDPLLHLHSHSRFQLVGHRGTVSTLLRKDAIPPILASLSDDVTNGRLRLSNQLDSGTRSAISIYNWEQSRTKACLEYMPAIIRFLRYNPVPPSERRSDRLVDCRTALGLSKKESAQGIGVDASTLARPDQQVTGRRDTD